MHATRANAAPNADQHVANDQYSSKSDDDDSPLGTSGIAEGPASDNRAESDQAEAQSPVAAEEPPSGAVVDSAPLPSFLPPDGCGPDAGLVGACSECGHEPVVLRMRRHVPRAVRRADGCRKQLPRPRPRT
jgi:hypothetical protein